jgi:HlyD family secretion protein
VLPEVTLESIQQRDLQQIVSASGKVQPRRQVNVSATTMGRVTRLAVSEGQRVKAGQFLLEIDPRALAGQIERGEASVAAARSTLQQAAVALDQATVLLEQARQVLARQRALASDGLTSRESLERAENDVSVREADVKARRQDMQTRQEQIRQEAASLASTRYSLSQVTIAAPMDGVVTRRNIELGENVVVGTMNNAGTVLMTIADMSSVQAEIEVDETDVPTVTLGQAATITIDAVPNRAFRGHVIDIGNSPIQTNGQTTTGQRQSTTFKVVVSIDEPVPDVRPGFTCSAEIVTATRTGAVAVPIQALTVRDLLFDRTGTLVREPPPPAPRRGFRPTPAAIQPPPPAEPGPGQTRRETEGVFAFRDGRAIFTPLSVGIAGERYFEVRSGLAAGDRVLTGPFDVVRQLADGSSVVSRPQR